MSLIINHNISALQTHRNLTASGIGMAKSIEKLSSGYRINVGADDPSGLIISEQLRSQISGLERAVRNSSEAYNLIGIAEGALNEMNSILKKMRSLAIHAANNGITSPEQVAADQAEMDSGIATLNRIANTTRYSDQYLLNGSKELVYDISTFVNEPTDHSLLNSRMTRVDQVFKRDGVKLSIGYAGEKSPYQANSSVSAHRAYLEADNAHPLCEISGAGVTARQEFILTGNSGSRMFSFKSGTHLGTIVESLNNVRDSTGIGASLIFASDNRIDKTINGIPEGGAPDYGPPPVPAKHITGYNDGTYVYQTGDVQIYKAGLNDPKTSKIQSFCLTPSAAAAFKVGFNCDGDGKIYAKVIDKSTNAIEYYKDKECTMLIGKGDDQFFAAANNSEIPSSPMQNLDGIFIKLNNDNVDNLDVFEIGVVGQRLDNQKDMNINGLQGWTDVNASVMSGVNLGTNTASDGSLFYKYTPLTFETDGETVKTFKVEAFTHSSYEPRYLVASSGEVSNNVNVPKEDDPATPDVDESQLPGQTVRLESVIMANGQDSGLNITLNMPKAGQVEAAMSQDGIKTSPAYRNLESKHAKLKQRLDVEIPARKAAILEERTALQNKIAANNTEITTQKGLKSTALASATLDPIKAAQLTTLQYSALDAAVVAGGGTAGTESNALLDDIFAQYSTYMQANNVGGKTWTEISAALKTTIKAGAAYSAIGALSPAPTSAADTFIDTALAALQNNFDSIVPIDAEVTRLSNANTGFTADSDKLNTELTVTIPAEEAALPGQIQDLADAMQVMLDNPSAAWARMQMPKGQQVGQVAFTNLGMRLFSMDYGSAETIRIQNNAGNLFYQYRESDTMEKLMVAPDTTVQVAGQDAQISLNGAPVFTTGLVANTTTPDFSGSLVFNSGTLGCTTLAVAGYDAGKLFSRATTLQGIEENEDRIVEDRRHIEPPAVNVTMGKASTSGLLAANGTPVNLYLDFSQLAPTVEGKIRNDGVASKLAMSYNAATQELEIDATALGPDLKIRMRVNPSNFADGFYVTDPALKGLFIKTDALIDMARSTADFGPENASVAAYAGNVMLEVNTFATNPRSNTTESLENFLGGMQFQLGNTEGDQDRTIYSIQSMSMSNLGRITHNNSSYCLQDVLGGGLASLSRDPIMAMRVLSQAVDDVSSLRARLGAFQSNMLQTNINNLDVAIVNITKTESAIRDTDMAEESTQFTRFQIMQQAGTSMLAQANQVSQNVLSLLK